VPYGSRNAIRIREESRQLGCWRSARFSSNALQATHSRPFYVVTTAQTLSVDPSKCLRQHITRFWHLHIGETIVGEHK
jgi:hypothetical protein